MLDGLTDGELADRLAARTLELVDLPSESRDEARAAAHVLGVLRAGGHVDPAVAHPGAPAYAPDRLDPCWTA